MSQSSKEYHKQCRLRNKIKVSEAKKANYLKNKQHPPASANTEEEVVKLNHFTNLQTLWAVDNLVKGAKILCAI